MPQLGASLLTTLRGLIYGHEIFIIQATDILDDPYLDNRSKLRIQGAQNMGNPHNLFCCAPTAISRFGSA
jgi:hypothetical protein